MGCFDGAVPLKIPVGKDREAGFVLFDYVEGDVIVWGGGAGEVRKG